MLQCGRHWINPAHVIHVVFQKADDPKLSQDYYHAAFVGGSHLKIPAKDAGVLTEWLIRAASRAEEELTQA